MCPRLCKVSISVPMTVQAFLQLYPWLCKCTRGGASFYKCALGSASFFKAVQVCPWLCKVNISVPVTVQAILKLYKCARGYVRLI